MNQDSAVLDNFKQYEIKEMGNSLTDNNYVLGAEIGGTHITTALVDLEKKELIRGSKFRANVNSQGTAHTVLNAWIDALGNVISKSDKPVMHIGIAMPGPFDYENGISLIQNMHKYDALYGMDIRKIFGEKLTILLFNRYLKNLPLIYLRS